MQFNRTSCKWYGDKKCPRRPEVHISTAWEAMIIIIGLLILSGMSYGGFYAFTIYRQRGSYVEQINTEDGNVTPPIYSWWIVCCKQTQNWKHLISFE